MYIHGLSVASLGGALSVQDGSLSTTNSALPFLNQYSVKRHAPVSAAFGRISISGLRLGAVSLFHAVAVGVGRNPVDRDVMLAGIATVQISMCNIRNDQHDESYFFIVTLL